MIKIEYDGKWPTLCSGTLTISKDDKKIYSRKGCCKSTGCVWFDDDWREHVEYGELIWEDADIFSQEIQDAVKDKLSEYNPCCGGCI